MRRVREVRIINGERIVFLRPQRPGDYNPLLKKHTQSVNDPVAYDAAKRGKAIPTLNT